LQQQEAEAAAMEREGARAHASSPEGSSNSSSTDDDDDQGAGGNASGGSRACNAGVGRQDSGGSSGPAAPARRARRRQGARTKAAAALRTELGATSGADSGGAAGGAAGGAGRGAPAGDDDAAGGGDSDSSEDGAHAFDRRVGTLMGRIEAAPPSVLRDMLQQLRSTTPAGAQGSAPPLPSAAQAGGMSTSQLRVAVKAHVSAIARYEAAARQKIDARSRTARWVAYALLTLVVLWRAYNAGLLEAGLRRAGAWWGK
jgi:hypothetical protein